MVLKSILVLHRYLGVVLGLIMTMWCLSGFVMMYQSFPETTQEERLAGLPAFDPGACCDLSQIPLRDDAEISAFTIEPVGSMLTAQIVADGEPTRYDLNSLQPIDDNFPGDDLRQAALDFAASKGISTPPVSFEIIRYDQWSVYGWNRQAPTWKAVFDDPGRTYVYVSGGSGQVFQDANSRERLLSWFGAIPHWLYPSVLRANQPVWYQTVIWLTLVGIFLTVTGLVVGISKLRGKSGRWFPYRRPMWFLHHVFGFFAGLLVLSWVGSGLLTMQPWGLLESPSSVSRSQVVTPSTWREVREAFDAVRAKAGEEVVQVRLAPLLGETALVARGVDGGETRYTTGGFGTVGEDALAARLDGADPVFQGADVQLLDEPDAYYYGHKSDVPFPVYRVTLDDADETRIYLDAGTGEVRRVADGTAKRYRWLESGLHTFDFPVLRMRPLWDLVVLPLMAVVTFVCLTGTWLSFTRIGRDVTQIRRSVAGRKKTGPSVT